MQDESTAKRPSRAEVWHSDGFAAPTFTMVPNDLFDEIAPHLTEAELRVLLYVLRRTFGWQKDADTISLSQMTEGITGQDGHAVDHGTGMSKVGVRRGVTGLEAKGLLVTVPNQSAARGHEATTYRLRFRGPLVNDVNKGGKPSLPALVHEAYTQKNTLQNMGTETRTQDWAHVLAALEQQMKAAMYDTYVVPLQPRQWTAARLELAAPAALLPMLTRFRPLILKAVRATTQEAPAITFVPRA